MKYTTALLAFAVGALAQSSVTSAPATTAAPEVSPSISCVQACDPADVTCQASCLGIARPNSSQAVETNECAARCDQGDGTAEATKKYSDCVQSCIASLFPSSQTGAQIPAGAASSGAASSGAAASGTGTRSTNPTASTGASGSGPGSSVSQTGSAAPQATGAANSVSARIGGAGLAGLLAVFAL